MVPEESHRPALLVVTSTYPRHTRDTLPRFVHDLASRLTADFDVHVLAPSTPGAAGEETMDGVQVHRFRYFFRRFETLANVHGFLPALQKKPWQALLLPFFLIAEVRAIARLVRRCDIALIHAHWIIPQGFSVRLAALPRRRRPPVVVTCHGADLFALDQRFFRLLKRFALDDAAAVTVVSQAARRRALELGTRAERTFVYPMGVDLTRLFTPDPKIQRSSNTVLFVGRLSEKKGVGVLIQALARVKEALPWITADIVGDGPDRGSLETLAVRKLPNGTVTFHGAVPHRALPEFYNRASCFVLPSVVARGGDQEGLGLVVVEAMGCRCPVVASRLDAVLDVVRDGQNGLLFTPGDPADLAAKLIHVLRNPAEARGMANQARADAQSRFDWEPASRAYRELFLEVLNGGTQPARETTG
jgi:glycosyltransferase involved in cell wall biosynthesis